jgi:aspartyl-tRNA(Asn)/glutamyl-tRNA(Gln) amidotransferase subunit A
MSTGFDMPRVTIAEAATALANGSVSTHELVARALAQSSVPDGEGSRVLTQRYDARALDEARHWDTRRAAGIQPGLLAGLPLTVKDLFDIAGQVTTAGSRVLAGSPPAEADADVVIRLREAGAIVVGKTNMTEFAYSGLGINPHFGTPRNPYDRARGLIPGGSSSGAAVSVTDGMAIAAIGSDTGGSVRIPAALCGLVGFKPSASRISQRGSIPLAPSLDSVGPLAHSVECCALLDAVMAGLQPAVPPAVAISSVRIGVARTLVWGDVDAHVAASVQAALTRLSNAGADVQDVALPDLNDIPTVNATGGLAAAESYAWHRKLLERAKSDYDPRVAARIEQGARMSAADYLDVLDARTRIQRSVANSIHDGVVWAMPTVPCVAPEIAALDSDERYFAANRLMLRNPSLVNFLDGCAITLPCHAPGTPPVGLSLVAARGQDRHLLAIARTLAPLVAAR